MKRAMEAQRDIVRAAEEAMTAYETPTAVEEADVVPNQEDVDHA